MRRNDPKDTSMTQLYALLAACMVFAPVAIMALNQAAQIVA